MPSYTSLAVNLAVIGIAGLISFTVVDARAEEKIKAVEKNQARIEKEVKEIRETVADHTGTLERLDERTKIILEEVKKD